MYSRVTLLEIDTLRIDIDSALELFRERVLPQLREQHGYDGVYVLTTPEGKALILSLWETEADAADAQTRVSDPELASNTMLFSAPPGREGYDVSLVDVPSVV